MTFFQALSPSQNIQTFEDYVETSIKNGPFSIKEVIPGIINEIVYKQRNTGNNYCIPLQSLIRRVAKLVSSFYALG